MDNKLKKERLKIRIWGARGSVPSPGKAFDRYGGDTTCVEIPRYNIIMDAGTGIRKLGMKLLQEDRVQSPLHIFFSHYHWDHIQGLPFFLPIYMEGKEVHLYGMGDVSEILSEQMRPPYFPMPYKALTAQIVHHTIDIGDEIKLKQGVTLTFYPTRHPQETLAMRIRTPEGIFIFSTDHEHDAVYCKELGKGFQRFTANVDAMLVDCQYTDNEYEKKIGWGHSSVSQVIKLANDCRPRKLLLSHHDPMHTDSMVRTIEKDVQNFYAETHACRSTEEIIV